MKGVIICATQRSGSTMVLEDMRNTGVLGIPEEYFIPWNPSKKNVDWEKSLLSIIKRSSSENGFFSIKVMANHLPLIDECLRGTKYDVDEDIDSSQLYPRFYNAFKGCKFLMIRRDNIVRQAVSREISRQTGINHATQKETDTHFAGNLLPGYSKEYNDSVRYKKDALDREILKISSENTLWESFFETNGINNPLVLRYEQVCKNFPNYLKRIALFSNIELDNSFEFVKRKMVKLSNNKNDEWVRNYLIDSGYKI